MTKAEATKLRKLSSDFFALATKLEVKATLTLRFPDGARHTEVNDVKVKRPLKEPKR